MLFSEEGLKETVYPQNKHGAGRAHTHSPVLPNSGAAAQGRGHRPWQGRLGHPDRAAKNLSFSWHWLFTKQETESETSVPADHQAATGFHWGFKETPTLDITIATEQLLK